MPTIRETAEYLVKESLEAEPNLIKVYLFPSDKEIRLIEVDATAQPLRDDHEIEPFYFGRNSASGIDYPSAIALIRPEDVEQGQLPQGWGDWNNAEIIHKAA